MKLKHLKSIFVGVLLVFGFLPQANATIYTVSFQLNSSVVSVLDFDSNKNLFTISGSFIDALFGATGYKITEFALDSNHPTTNNGSSSLPTGIDQLVANQILGNSGVTNITKFTSALPFQTDVRYLFTGTNGVFEGVDQGESLSFVIPGLNPTCLTAISQNCNLTTTALSASTFAIKAERQGVITWLSGAAITPTAAVPEPETNALWLVGLSLLGLTSRRRYSHRRKAS